MKISKGFTLIEVLVALLIVAIAISACLYTILKAIHISKVINDYDIALQLAQNLALEQRAKQLNQDGGEIRIAQQKFYWTHQQIWQNKNIRINQYCIKVAVLQPCLVNYAENEFHYVIKNQ